MSGYGQIDEWARQIGFKVVRFVPVLDHGGWASASGARTYLHGNGDIPTAIFPRLRRRRARRHRHPRR